MAISEPIVKDEPKYEPIVKDEPKYEPKIKYKQFLDGGNLVGAKATMAESKFTFAELCNPQLKHCENNPLYGAIRGMPKNNADKQVEWKDYIKIIVDSVPQMLDIVANRVNVLSYLIMNTDTPDIAQLFISKHPPLLNDQSNYTEAGFKIYKPDYDSPVHKAVMGNRLQSLDVLIKNGANLNLKNVANVKPMDQYFINCNKLDTSTPSKLASAGGDVTFIGTTSYLTSGINNKCWVGLNKALPTSKAPMDIFQFNKIINNANNATGGFDKDAVTTAYLSLPHMAKDFDVKKYGEVNCKQATITNPGNCQKIIAGVMDMQHEHTLHASVADHHMEL